MSERLKELGGAHITWLLCPKLLVLEPAKFNETLLQLAGLDFHEVNAVRQLQ